jgi:hypothetical protein
MMYYYPNYFGGRCPSCGRCQHCGNSYPSFQPYLQTTWGGAFGQAGNIQQYQAANAQQSAANTLSDIGQSYQQAANNYACSH